ncbi:MAG: thiol-disulfide isomerase/thioredoxin [Planctomycetota bacterium]|jgi:thiol-disulfide isomerase/thioredoxin
MNKMFFAPMIALMLLFTACQEEVNGYKLEGQLKGLENQEVILEFLTPTELQQIDTIMTDAEGNFVSEGNLAEKGFYRLVNGQKFWIFLLDNTKSKLVANAADPKLREITISEYSAGEEFQNTINFLIEKQEEFGVESKKMQELMTSPESTDESKMLAQKSFEVFQNGVMESIRAKVTDLSGDFPYSAVYLLSSLNPQEDTDFIKGQIAEIEKTTPNSIYLNNIKDIIKKVEAQPSQEEMLKQQAQQQAQAQAGEAEVSGEAKEIVMNGLDGKTQMKLSDLRGKVVLVDFWASWCKPCRRDNPNVVKMYHEYKNKGFDIFSVSLDKSADRWAQAVAQDGLVWNSHVSDLKFWNNAAAKAWGVSSIPATFLLDKEGKVIAKNLRGAALEAKLKEILQ